MRMQAQGLATQDKQLAAAHIRLPACPAPSTPASCSERRPRPSPAAILAPALGANPVLSAGETTATKLKGTWVCRQVGLQHSTLCAPACWQAPVMLLRFSKGCRRMLRGLPGRPSFHGTSGVRRTCCAALGPPPTQVRTKTCATVGRTGTASHSRCQRAWLRSRLASNSDSACALPSSHGTQRLALRPTSLAMESGPLLIGRLAGGSQKQTLQLAAITLRL